MAAHTQAHAGIKLGDIGEHMRQANVAGSKNVGVGTLAKGLFLKIIKLRKTHEQD
jgi:hypothetical protein